jgi:predicted dehydrogenase
MTFRVGIIGAGAHGARYLRHAGADVPGMSAVALFRRDQEAAARLAEESNCRSHRSADDLIADPQVDGVIISTPPSSHFPLARAVLEAGKPLLLEKPFTATLEQAGQLAELDRQAPAPPLMVAQTLRWNPVILKVKELWERLGKVHLVRLAQRLEPTSLSWQRDPAVTVGGSVLLTGVHLFDTARFLTGAEFEEIDSRQAAVMNPVVEDLFLARAVMSGGCWASLEVSKYTASRAAWLEAVGEEGQIFADYLKGGVVLRRGPHEEFFDVSARVPTLPQVLSAWMAAVTGGTAMPVGAADGLATMEVVDACYRSAALNQAVAI